MEECWICRWTFDAVVHPVEEQVSLCTCPDKLKAVASEYTQRQEWKSALSVGHDLAKSQSSLAADIACTLMQEMPRQSSDYKLVFQTLPWLQAAKRHEEVIEVSNCTGQLTAPQKHGKNDFVLMQHSSQHARPEGTNSSSLCLTSSSACITFHVLV